MKNLSKRMLVGLCLSSGLLGVVSCATETTSIQETGTIELALMGVGASGVEYHLRDANISVTGPGNATFSTEDYLGLTQITSTLPAGTYQLSLAEGWRMETSDGTVVPASLLSSMPISFTVFDGQSTPVPIDFLIEGEPVSLGEGEVVITIGITEEDEDECNLPALPDAEDLPNLGLPLPDPFTFLDGTPVTTKAQWECRRKEILAMAAKYLYGPVPGEPDSTTGSVMGQNIAFDVTVGGSMQSFSATITGSGSIIELDLAAGILPGSGKSLSFGGGYESQIQSLYGLSELNPNIAIGWMIDRVMDVLEQNPGSGHDPTKIAVSGCSGCGKGAFLVGVFSRVPMTVIVESGGGGAGSWRMNQWYRSGQGSWQCGDLPQGIDNLEESGICGPWVTSAATPFRNNPEMVYSLPFDQHLLLATIAPRYLVHFSNDNGPNSWCHLGGTAEALSAWAAYPVYEALGVPERMAFDQYSGGHCGVGDTGIAAAMFDRAFNGNQSAATGGIFIDDNLVQLPVSQWPGLFVNWNMSTVLQ